MKNLHIKVLATFLCIIGCSLAFYKYHELGFPLVPKESTEAWTVEARISFQAHPGPTKVSFFIPGDMPGFTTLDEDFISSNYGLAIANNEDLRTAHWAVRRVAGEQVLYYRVELAPVNELTRGSTVVPPYPEAPHYDEPYRAAILSLLDQVRSQSADVFTFTQELLKRVNTALPDKNVEALLGWRRNDEEWVRELIRILAGARIPARMVSVLELKDGVRYGSLVPWLEVHNGQEWIAFNPKTGTPGYNHETLLWRVGQSPLVTVEGGEPAEVEFSMVKQSRALVSVVEQRARQVDSKLMEFSLFSLPVHSQNVFRIILLLPVGALLVALMRNLIGIKTFGTFMPILIALAFRETQLLAGLILFVALVSIGLAIRFYMERLHLLLVPRLAAVLTIVILVAAVLSIVLNKLGIQQGVSIALFPVVILAMTIERMSLVWEEHGPTEAIQQGMGSLFVAALGYVIMNLSIVMHWVFVFPEVHLVILACLLLLGRYTGYRLSELWRFRSELMKSD